MARPRGFDEGAVLDIIVTCFWNQGFDATSMRHLERATGLTAASLYNAFGDKRALYRRALDRYVEMSFVDRVGRFETNYPPKEAIAAFFSEIVARSLADQDRKGCMLVNSALEVAPHDPEFQRVVSSVLVEVEAFFSRCVAAGQADNTISKQQSAADLGRMLLGMLLGLRVLARTRPEAELLQGLVRPALATLEVQPRYGAD